MRRECGKIIPSPSFNYPRMGMKGFERVEPKDDYRRQAEARSPRVLEYQRLLVVSCATGLASERTAYSTSESLLGCW